MNPIHGNHNSIPQILEQLAGKADRSIKKITDKIDVTNPSQNINFNGTIPKWAQKHAKIHQKFNAVIKKLTPEELSQIPEKITASLDRSQQIFNILITNNPELELDFIKKPDSNADTKNSLGWIDDKMLAFIHGDPFIQATGLEGGDPIANIRFLLPYLKQKEARLESKTVLSLLGSIENFPRAQFAASEDAQRAFHSVGTQFSHSLSKKILSLQAGERILLSGGWSASGPGHAMLYLIEKTEDGRYAFTVINTGSGINYHESKVLGLKQKFLPIYRLKDIDVQYISNPNFISSLGELMLPTNENGISWEHKPNDIYERILPSLNGNRDYAFEKEVEFITVQRSGVCSWKSLMKLLQVESGNYKAFTFDLRRDSLRAYFQQGKHSDRQMLLLKRAAESFARMSLKFYKQGLIDYKEYADAKDLSQTILDSVREYEQQLAQTNVCLLQYDKLQPCQLPIPAEVVAGHSPPTPEAAKTYLFQKSPVWLKAQPPESLLQVHTIFNEVNAFCLQSLEEGDPHRALRALTQMVKTFPDNAVEPSGYWSEILKDASEAEIAQTMNLLLESSRLLMSHMAALPLKERGTPEHLALVWILGAFSTRLSRALGSEANLGFNQMSLHPWEKNYNAIVASEKLNSLFSNCKKYLDEIELENKAPTAKRNANYVGLHNYIDFDASGQLKSSDSNSSLIKIMKNPRFLEKIFTRHPNLKGKSEKHILEDIFPRLFTEDLFPTEYRCLVQQELLFRYLINNPSLDKIKQTKGQLLGAAEINTISSSGDHLGLEIKFNGSDHYFNECYGWNEDKHWFRNLFAPIEHTGYASILDEMLGIMNIGRAGEDKGRGPQINKWSEFPMLATWRPPHIGMSFSEGQELALMFSKKAVFIPSLCSYLKTHSEALLDRDFQLMVYYAFFAGDAAIAESLERFPEAGIKLGRQLNQLIEFHQSLGNTQTQYFLLQILERLESHLTPPERTARKQLEQLLSAINDKNIGNKRLKALGFVHLLASYSDHRNFTPEEVKTLVSAYCYIKAFGYEERYVHPHDKHRIEETMNSILSSSSFVEIETQKAIAQEIGSAIFGLHGNSWEQEGLLFSDPVNNVTIDLGTLALYQNNNRIGGLPDTIISRPAFQNLFGERPFVTLETQPGLFLLQIKNETSSIEDYRLYMDPGSDKLVIEKSIEGQWHAYISLEEVRNCIPECLVAGHHHWAEQLDLDRTAIRIEKANTGMTVAKIDFHADDSAKVIGTCTQIGKDLNLQLQDKSTINLCSFQPEGFYLNWENKRLEFPNAKIHFTKNDENEFLFSKDATLKLSQAQLPPESLPYYQGFIALEDRSGNKQYLIPREPINLDATGALGRNVTVSHTNKDGSYFQIEEKEGCLIGKTPEENLYLVYLFVAHKQYAEAERLLTQQLSGHPLGYSDVHEEIMSWILELNKSSQDQSPEALALKLKVLYLCSRNCQKHSANLNALSNMSQDLLNYYSTALQVKSLSLDPFEELELLERGNNYKSIEILNNRYLQLKGKAQEAEWQSTPSALEENLTLPNDISVETTAFSFSSIVDHYSGQEFFNLNGAEKLVIGLNQWVSQAVSPNIQEREMAIANLKLLKIPSQNENWVRQSLLILAHHGSPLECETFLSAWKDAKDFDAKLTCLLSHSKSISERIEQQTQDEELITEEVLIEEPIQKSTQQSASKKSKIPLTFKSDPDVTLEKDIVVLLKENGIELQEKPVESRNVITAGLVASMAPNKKDSPVIQQEAIRVQESLQLQEQKLSKTFCYQIEQVQLKQLETFFSTRLEGQQDEVDTLREQILATANQLPENSEHALKQTLKLLGKKKREITIDDLIVMYLQGNVEALQKRNPYLTQESVDTLTTLLNQYLLQSTESEYTSRLKTLTGKAINVLDKDDKQEALTNLDLALRENRCYKANKTKNKVLLIFEYYSAKRLRIKQYKTIKNLTIGDLNKQQNRIVQLLMGSGKTKVILPLLAYINSRGDNVPMIIVPDMLYETNLEDMRILLGELLNQTSYTINLAEGERLDNEKLEEISALIARIKQERSYCLVKSSTVHAIQLHFKEVLLDIGLVPKEESIPPELIERFVKLQSILNTLFQDVVLDEADTVLDCLKEVNFSAGELTPVVQTTQDSIEDIFLALADDTSLADFFQLHSETDSLFDEHRYTTEIKPRLAQIVLDTMQDKISAEDENTILLYLKSDPSIKNISNLMETLAPEVRDRLALGREFISTLFPMTLKKNVNENFGLSADKHIFKAIPYVRSNTPSEGSEFSNPFETMIYTTLYYCRMGVTKDQFQEVIKICKAQAIAEYESMGIPLEETAGYRRFEALKLVPEKTLFTLNDNDILSAVSTFNASMENKILFAREFGWQEIGTYERKLTSTPQHLCGLFRHILGFTGTLWNEKTFPATLKTKPQLEDDGMTLGVLKSSNSEVLSYGNLDALYKSLAGYHACIDAGAWFRGLSAHVVAQEMLKHLPESITTIVYFNDQDNPPGTKGQAVVLQRGKDELDLLSNTVIPEAERFTYYNITVGADITQDPHAKALTTVSKNMLLRDLLQGVWRMRQLDKKQKCDFAVSDELVAGLEDGKTLEAIFKLCIHNQGTRQEEDNLRALKQKISYLAESAILDVCKDPTTPIEEALLICRDLPDLLAPTTSMSPYELFGQISEKKSTHKAIESYIAKTLSSLKPIYEKHALLAERCSLETLEESMRKLADYTTLPKKDSLRTGTDNGTEMQVRKETQVQQKTETMTELKVEVVVDVKSTQAPRATLQPMPLTNLFNEEYWKQRKLFDVNTLLQAKADVLKSFDATKSVFSDKIRFTYNIGAVSQAPNTPLFQAGTMPLSTCVLQVFPDESMKAVFVDPNEAEFLSMVLDFDRELAQNPELNEQLEKWYDTTIKIKIEEFEKLGRLGGKSIKDIFAENNIVYTEENCVELYKAGKFQEIKVLSNISTFKSSSIDKRLEIEQIPKFWKNKLDIESAHKMFNQPREFNITLVDLHLGILKQGATAIDEASLLENPHYAELIAQAKFYNGSINHYTRAERECLKKWISEQGIDNMQALLKNVLRSRPKILARYPNSQLQQAFDQAAIT